MVKHAPRYQALDIIYDAVSNSWGKGHKLTKPNHLFALFREWEKVINKILDEYSDPEDKEKKANSLDSCIRSYCNCSKEVIDGKTYMMFTNPAFGDGTRIDPFPSGPVLKEALKKYRKERKEKKRLAKLAAQELKRKKRQRRLDKDEDPDDVIEAQSSEDERYATESETESEPEPEPAPKPKPEPKPKPKPKPEPAPAPKPEPTPAPAPEAAPEPEPEPQEVPPAPAMFEDDAEAEKFMNNTAFARLAAIAYVVGNTKPPSALVCDNVPVADKLRGMMEANGIPPELDPLYWVEKGVI